MLLRYTKKLVAGILAVSFLFLLVSIFSEASEPTVLPVLVYHHIQEKVQSDVSCTPEQFETQILALKRAGFTPLNLTQTQLFLAGALTGIARPVLVTFDDGYESLYHFALPIARKLNFPMTVFVVTSRIGRKLQFAQYLNENQIREMSESGLFDFGSHTHDLHTETTVIYDAFGDTSENPVNRLISRDLRISSSRLESIVGHRPQALAWPYGKFNSIFTAAARLNGYKLHFTSAAGYNEPGANPFAIKRIPVTARDNPVSVIRKAGSGFR